MDSSSISSSDKVIGLLCSIGSAIFNGSFTSPFKTKRIVQLNVHPIIFQLYVCVGIFVSSLLTLIFQNLSTTKVTESEESIHTDDRGGDGEDTFFTFTSFISLYGILAGFLFVIAVSGSFLAIDCIGIALAQGIWGGGAIIVSWLWGVVCFHEIPSSIGLSILGLALLICGVVGIAFNELISKVIINTLLKQTRIRQKDKGDGDGDCGEEEDSNRNSNESTPLMKKMMMDQNDDRDDDDPNSSIGINHTKQKTYVQGLFWACTVGLSGGSILAPLHYVPPEKQGLVVFLPSFGTGTIILSPLVLFLYYYYYWILRRSSSLRTSSSSSSSSEQASTPTIQEPIILFHIKDGALLMGILSGFVWNIGNTLSIIAIPKIGYGVAYPIMQCAIVISGLWGIYIFHEIIHTTQIIIFWSSSIIIIIGGFCLSSAQ